MTVESAPEAPGQRPAGGPSGFRRLTPSLLAADHAAAGFRGLPDGVAAPGQLLAAFKAAVPCLGLSSRLVQTIDWLFCFTQPQDWARGARPIVWPSAGLQRDALSLSASQVKMVNRGLIEAGLISMKDSPNGKRYGRRDPKDRRIVEAYGFDLSPLAARHAEFVRLAAEARAERVEMGRLRRRATIARNGITQILETVAEYGLPGEDWVTLARESQKLARSLRTVERIEAMALGVVSLERRQREGRERLAILLSTVAPAPTEAVSSDPKGPENRPHQYTYQPALYPQEDTVVADEEACAPAGLAVPDPATPEAVEPSRPEPPPAEPQTAKPVTSVQPSPSMQPAQPVQSDEAVLKLSTEELVQLAPRLRSYLATPAPTWPDVVVAADWLRSELGVSQPLWGEACLAMGREAAAVAVAIVSAKPDGHFRTSPGGYFHGMIAKAKAGELNLARTIWGWRAQAPHTQERRIPYRPPGAGTGAAFTAVGQGRGVARVASLAREALAGTTAADRQPQNPQHHQFGMIA